ncbi:PREDICTED: uncharacterized protein LOC109476561 [Branchiostoma belcheri]|uniref:Uncharacterized protein LOC109476561 n=1 Tax=Branchiostoma belcheri TaxID=7741 RepID=A0A6P4YUM9_BRABE|nr:PREDICTED: uncharacterized protein LOC109476561 [Branchiostoma belcheri]
MSGPSSMAASVGASTLYIAMKNVSPSIFGPVKVSIVDDNIVIIHGSRKISAQFPEGSVHLLEVCREVSCHWDCCVLDCKCPQPDNHIFLQLSISTAPENVAQLRCVIDNYLTPNKDAWHQTPNIERQVADLTATTDLETEDEVCDDCGYRIFRSLEELDATHRAVIATLYRQCMECGF